MREISLTQGKVALVDDEDFERINQFKWYAGKSGNTFYALRRKHHSSERMHNLILNPQNGLQTDHIDGNGLNNQKSNLRAVTIRENQQNRHTNKASRYPGVYWSEDNKRWRTAIRINGKRKYLGSFTTEEMAHTAYQKAIKMLV